MDTIYLSDLDWVGLDTFARPMWRHRVDGQHYCVVDLLVTPGPDSERVAMSTLMYNPFTQLFRKDDGPEGEPTTEVLFLFRPAAVRCVFAPEGQSLFTVGREYPLGGALHQRGHQHDPRCAELHDDQGGWHPFKAEPKTPGVISTGVTAVGGRSLALFEYVQPPAETRPALAASSITA
jgi:hypothetical protein